MTLRFDANNWLTMPKRVIIPLAFLFTLAAVSFMATPALAQDQEEDEEEPLSQAIGLEYEISVGAELISWDNDNFKYGEYSGIDKEGVYALGDVDLNYYDKGLYVDLRAKDLGYDSRSAYLLVGKAASHTVFVRYDSIPRLWSQSATAHDGVESEQLTLPDGFTRGADPAAIAGSLGEFKKDVDLRFDRESVSAGYSSYFGPVKVDLSFKSESKNGVKSIGSVVGNFSGDRKAIVLPEPIDYNTDEIQGSLEYKNDHGHIAANYYLSTFYNNKDFMSWDNPYTFGPETAKTALPADSEHQRYGVSGSWNFGEKTRLVGVAEWGSMTQNEDLTAFTNNLSGESPALPRSTADAQLDTTYYMLKLSSRALPKLALSAEWKFYQTENKTPIDLFRYVRNDGTQQFSASSANALYNLPYDQFSNRYNLTATYNVMRRTNVKLEYISETVDRDFREINKTTENTFKIGVNHRIPSLLSVRVNYSIAAREADDAYDPSRFFGEYHSQDYLDSISNEELRFINNPDIRKFDIADRDRTKLGVKVNLFPIPIATVGLFYNYFEDDYTASLLGLEKSENENWTLDVTVTPSENVTLYAFYTLENIRLQQKGRFFADASSTEQVQDENRNWIANNFEETPTYGVGANLVMLENKLTLDADFSLSESTTSIRVSAGNALRPGEELPDLKTKRAIFSLIGRYAISESLKLGLGYKYDTYTSDDFSTDGLDPLSGDLGQVVTMTSSIPDYKAHIGMVVVTYSFSNIE